MTQPQTSDTRTRSTASGYRRRDPASAAARFDRLLKAASEGKTLSQFARAEGIHFSSLDKWLAARPVYAEQVEHMRRGPKDEVSPAEEQRRLAAVRHFQSGMRWKQAARLAGVDVIRVQSWFYKRRAELDGLGERDAEPEMQVAA